VQARGRVSLQKRVRRLHFRHRFLFCAVNRIQPTNGVAMGSVKKKRLKKMSKHKRKKQLKALRHKNK
jgi:hypothetical protein